jgi:hypothetical protein
MGMIAKYEEHDCMIRKKKLSTMFTGSLYRTEFSVTVFLHSTIFPFFTRESTISNGNVFAFCWMILRIHCTFLNRSGEYDYFFFEKNL